MALDNRIGALRVTAVLIGIAFLLWAWSLRQNHNHCGAWIVLAIDGGLIVVGTVFERRYRPNIDRSKQGWIRTGERFIDPVTGESVEVWFNEVTGERDYRTVGN